MNYDPFSTEPHETAQTPAEVSNPQKQSKKPNLLIFLSVIVCGLSGIVMFFLSISYEVPAPFLIIPSLVALPVPVVCIVLGAKRKKVDPQYKGTMLGGIAIALLVCLFVPFGLFVRSFPTDMGNVTTTRDLTMLEEVEGIVGIDFPAIKAKNVTMSIWGEEQDDSIKSTALSKTLRTTDATYTKQADVESLKALLEADDRWIETVPNSLYGLFPGGYNAPVYYSEHEKTLVLLYNVDTGEFNRVPDATGTYRFLSIRVDFEKNIGIFAKGSTAYLSITEYELDYLG